MYWNLPLSVFAIVSVCLVAGSWKPGTKMTLRGPHVCGTLNRRQCCTGWKLSSPNGRCLSPVCSHGCGGGVCIQPNGCLCPNGQLAPSCGLPTPGNAGSNAVTCQQLRCQHSCQNHHGYPQCSCLTGFVLREDGSSCEDLDECRRFPHICQQGCLNTPGSFMCTCYRGYTLLDGGRACRPLHDYGDSPCGGRKDCSKKPQSRSYTRLGQTPRVFPCGKNCNTREHLHPILPNNERTVFPSNEHLVLTDSQHLTLEKNKHQLSTGQPFKNLCEDCDWSNQFTDGDRQNTNTGDCIGNGCLDSRPCFDENCLEPQEEMLQKPQDSGCHDSGCQDSGCHGSGCHFSKTVLSEALKINPAFKNVFNTYQKSGKLPTGSHDRKRVSASHTARSVQQHHHRRQLKQQQWKLEQQQPQLEQRRRQQEQQHQQLHNTKQQQPQQYLQIEHMKRQQKPQQKDRDRPLTKTTTQAEAGKPRVYSRKLSALERRFKGGFLPVKQRKFGATRLSREGEIKSSRPVMYSKLISDGMQQDDGRTCRGDLCNQPERRKPDSKTPPPVEVSQARCPEGYQHGVIDGKAVCQRLRKSVLKKQKSKRCPPGEKPTFTSEGVRCVGSERPIACAEGQILVDSSKGKRCLDVATTPLPLCGPGQKLVQDGTWFRCAEISTTTIMTTTQRPTTITSTSTSTTTSQPLCPTGLHPLITSVGVICQYIGMRGTLTTSPPVLSCPPEQIVINTADGEVCGFEAEIDGIDTRCPSGQKLVDGPHGLRCKRMNGGITPDKPCPSGQETVHTETGRSCEYRKTNVDLVGERGHICSESQIPTKTDIGFICKDVSGSEERLKQQCPNDAVIVKTEFGFECVNEEQVMLRCSPGQKLVKTQSGYFCRHAKFDFEKDCNEGEVLVIIDTLAVCKRLDKNAKLCGEDHRPQLTDLGFVCQPFHLNLVCPDGFHLIQTGGEPECVSLSRQDVSCIPSPGSPCPDKIIPCQDGYDIHESETGLVCQLEEYVEVVCHDSEDKGIPRCFTESVTNCSAEAKPKKSCKDLLRDIGSGCNPQCANGGSCQNGSCVCPEGITGRTCQEDIDECQQLPNGHCQFQCQNTFGSFVCVCPHGSTLNTDRRTCTALDCIPLCMNGGQCDRGSCVCPVGFTGSLCQNDVDECSERDNLCQHICRNTYGSYACICPPGSRLREDRRTCMNTTCIPECKNGGRCENHRCICPREFYGIICQLDRNECDEGNHLCSHICVNTVGGHYCSCPPGQVLKEDRQTCQHSRQV